MVSAAVPIPVVKSVAEVVAVHPATPARASVTWTMPRLALAVVPGAAEPRVALAGAVIERTPRTTGMLELHRGSELPDGQLLPGAAELTVLTRLRSPVAGSLTETEKVTVTVAPADRSPVQVRPGAANETEPLVAVASFP